MTGPRAGGLATAFSYSAEPKLLPRLESFPGFQRLLAGHLDIAGRQDGAHCAVCGRHIGFWYYGFPYPLCVFCKDHAARGARLCCPARPWAGCDTCPGRSAP